METFSLTRGTGDDKVEFVGHKIGHANSDDGKSLRWTEVEIYRTESSNYVVRKIGRSVVFHRVNGCETTTGVQHTGPLDPENWFPCPVCHPAEPAPDGLTVLEVDRVTTHISSTPEGCIETLISRDENGVRFTTKVARRAMEAARAIDPELKDAARITRVA